jgi:hypothetical protein
MKYAKVFIYRQQNSGKIFNSMGLFKEIPCVELIDVDKVEACCSAIRTNCTFKRTKDKLPNLMDGGGGPIIRSITSIDQSIELIPTFSSIYQNMRKSSYFMYNKNVYYWYLNGYIYIPNVEWDAVRIEALFDEDISELICSNDPRDCVVEQDRELSVPDYLFAEIEQMALKELFSTAQLPPDGADDQQNVMR